MVRSDGDQNAAMVRTGELIYIGYAVVLTSAGSGG